MEFETLNPQGGYNGFDANENEMQSMPLTDEEKDLQALQRFLLYQQKQLSRDAAEESIGSYNPDLQQPVNEEQRNARWESNHRRILKTIIDFIDKYGYMPSKTDIAISCSISRKSVHQHLKTYMRSHVFCNQIDHYQFLAPAIIDSLAVRSLKGDTRAAKLFLDNLNRVSSWKHLAGSTAPPTLEIGELKLTQGVLDNLNEQERQIVIRACARLQQFTADDEEQV